jgi:glycerophosphoryl diester phosphodiesterase
MPMSIALIALTALAAPPAAIYPPYAKSPVLIAHRGASGLAPEHTAAAYKLALEHGADFVEPDLQMTKDGVLVCLHDATLERTTDVEDVFPDRAAVVAGKKTWPVAEFTLAEIQKLDAGSWMGERFQGERVPTLARMVEIVRGKAGIIPETKAPEAYAKRGMNMERALMQALREAKLDVPGADPKTPVVIQSFSAASLKALRKDHGCKLPLIVTGAGFDPTAEGLRAVKLYADGIAPNKATVLSRPGLVGDAHAAGLSVTVWTFRSKTTGQFATVKEEMRHFIEVLKVDAVFTDNPEEFPRK